MNERIKTNSRNIRNYIIAFVLMIIGIIPFIYLFIEAISAYCNGYYLFDGTLVYGIAGTLNTFRFYLAFFFPIYIVVFLLIDISVVPIFYTKLK